MKYESGPTTYPTLGATLILKGDYVSQVDHELIAEASLPAQEIAEISTEQLNILWDAITFISGYAARQADRRVERIGTATASNPLSTNLRTQTGQGAIVLALRLPAETRLLSLTGRLNVWLRLANEARPPSSPINAIRNYYMICEDMHGRSATPGSPEEELKFIRDFVSHGDILTNPALLAFLRKEIGPGTQRYDSLNPTHQVFVERRLGWARQLVESEIKNKL